MTIPPTVFALVSAAPGGFMGKKHRRAKQKVISIFLFLIHSFRLMVQNEYAGGNLLEENTGNGLLFAGETAVNTFLGI